MSDHYLDLLPSREREKIRRRLRMSPEAYAALREKVKGPEDLEREMEKNAEFAEVRLRLETEPKTRENVASMVREAGTDAVDAKAPEAIKEAIKNGKFDVLVSHSEHAPNLSVKPKGQAEAPSGNVQEVYPLKAALQQKIVSSFRVKN